jgi:hypothetical protein
MNLRCCTRADITLITGFALLLPCGARHAAGELDALLEAQRTLGKRDQELAGMVRGPACQWVGRGVVYRPWGSSKKACMAW